MTASSISRTRSASFCGSCERASARNVHHSGTMLPGGPAADQPDVRGRLLVHAPELEVCDRLRRGRDRRTALLGVHAGVRGAPVDLHLHRVRVRRAEDHLADRGGLVVDVADPRVQPLLVERRCAVQTRLLHRREEQLEPAVRPVLRQDPARRLEHHGDGRLVVGAEDRPGRVADDAVLEHRVDARLRRNRVEMSAQEERRSAVGRLDAGVEVPRVRADSRAGVVLAHVEPEIAHVRGHLIRNRALVAGRARHCGELGEQRDDVVLSHAAILGRARRW